MAGWTARSLNHACRGCNDRISRIARGNAPQAGRAASNATCRGQRRDSVRSLANEYDDGGMGGR